MKRAAILLVAASSVSCGDVADVGAGGPGTLTAAIRNGDVANAREFQGIGAIHATATQVLCSGSLISRSLVLTAAQCLRDTAPGAVYQFSIGPSDALARRMRGNAPGRVAVATKVIPHALFDTADGINLAFDIAVLRLEKGESRGWKDVPRYAIARADVPTGVHVIGVGFGESGLRPAGTRTSGDFLVTQYVAGEGPIGNFIPRAFLEIEPGTDKDQMICPGDSGGPVFAGGELAGVASFRFVATCPERGAGYVVTAPRFTGWIADAVDELDPPGACAAEDDARFVTSGGGCKDLATGNAWSAPLPSPVTQAEAAAYCDDLVEAGRDDWRLATLAELRALDANMSPPDGDDDDHHGDNDRAARDDDARDAVRAAGRGAPYVDFDGVAWSTTAARERTVSTFDFKHHRAGTRRANAAARGLCVRTASPV